MPKLVWIPRKLIGDFDNALNQQNEWRGSNRILDRDYLVTTYGRVSGTAPAVDASYIAMAALPMGRPDSRFEALIATTDEATTSAYKVYRAVDRGQVTFAEVGLPASTTLDSSLFNGVMVDDVFGVVSTATKLLLWNSSVPSFADIAGTSGNCFLTAMRNRAFALSRLGILQWNVPGDYTDYVDTVAGAGTTSLDKVFGDFTGIKNVDNQLVLFARQGITIGVHTGLTTPAFRFDPALENFDCCVYPKTLAQHGRQFFYLGDSGIYMYERGQQTNIGEDVFAYIKHTVGPNISPYRYIGLLVNYLMPHTTGASVYPRDVCPRYLLLPQSTSFTDAGIMPSTKVLSYNLHKQSWETFDLASGQNYFFSWSQTDHAVDYPRFWNSTDGKVDYLGTTGAVSSSIACSGLVVEDSTRDYTSDELYITYIDKGEVSVTVILTCMLNSTSQSVSLAITLGTVGASGRLMKHKFPVRGITGQFWGIQIDIGATTTPFVMYGMELTFVEGGQYRGV